MRIPIRCLASIHVQELEDIKRTTEGDFTGSKAELETGRSRLRWAFCMDRHLLNLP